MLLSIITPCFNHGQYLDEMLDSISQTINGINFEIIIMNDGSSDLFTIQKLKNIQDEGRAIVLHQQNQGLGAARNNAIKSAKGKYILPLDADNKLNKEFANQSVDLLEANNEISVVYTDCIFFGERSGYHKVGDFDMIKLIGGNYIDACAVYRKLVWEECGGYDEKMPVMGHEDWDLWLNMISKGHKFYYNRIPGFYYRVVGNSMLRTVTIPGGNKNEAYIARKYSSFIANYYHQLYREYERYERGVNGYMKSNKLKAAFKILFNRWDFL